MKSKKSKKKSNKKSKPYPIPVLDINKLSKTDLYKYYLKAGKAWEKMSGRSEDLGVMNKDSTKEDLKNYIKWYNSEKARELWKQYK